MINILPTVLATILVLIGLVACQQKTGEPTGGLPVTMDDSSRVIIDRAIGYAVGLAPAHRAHRSDSAWHQKQTLSFDKKSISYDSTGKITRELDQHFDYMLKPEFRAKVTYRLHDTVVTLIHDGQQARKLFNGKASTQQKDIDNAWNSSFGSQFVISMPYKLKDPGLKADYVGRMTLSDGTPAQVVKTSFMKGAGSYPDHVWYYYFEPGTGKLLANSLNDKGNFWDYTRYERFDTVDGLLMPAHRKTYVATGLNKPVRLSGESTHSRITFNNQFPADHFKLPDEK